MTDFIFAEDGPILVESREVLVVALRALHRETKSLQLQFFWAKTKARVFGRYLDEAVHSVRARRKDIGTWYLSHAVKVF